VASWVQETAMKCPECLGTAFEEGKFELAHLVDSAPVLIKNVPASKCRQCGYLVISGVTAGRLQDIVKAPQPDSFVKAAVYDMDAGGKAPIKPHSATARRK
jgi:YgiT-type zinc finger domain-containing protein